MNVVHDVAGLKVVHSRSYPNTPQPNVAPTSFPLVRFPVEDGNGCSRSYPSTPLCGGIMQQSHEYPESTEPMLSSPTLNTLNMHGQRCDAATGTGNIGRAEAMQPLYSVVDLLESGNIFAETEGESGDLETLGHFEELSDVHSLGPLFTEVVESNR